MRVETLKHWAHKVQRKVGVKRRFFIVPIVNFGGKEPEADIRDAMINHQDCTELPDDFDASTSYIIDACTPQSRLGVGCLEYVIEIAKTATAPKVSRVQNSIVHV